MSAWPSRYLCISVSSTSAAASSSFERYSAASSLRFSGISTSWYFAPIVSSSKVMPFILMRSTMPRNLSSAPIGIWSDTGRAWSFCWMVWTARK